MTGTFLANSVQIAILSIFNPMVISARFRVFAAILAIILTGTHAVGQTMSGGSEELKKALMAKDYRKASLLTFETGQKQYEARQIPDALKTLNSAINYATKSTNASLTIEPAMLLGKISVELGDYKKATEYFATAAAAATKSGNHAAEFESHVLLAKANGSLKKYKKAIDALDHALELALQAKSVPDQMACYRLLETYHSLNGNTGKAAENRHHHEALALLQEKEQQAQERARELENTLSAEKEGSQRLLNEQQVLLVEQRQRTQAVEDELELSRELRARKQLEIDLLNKDRELANLRIQEQNSRLETEGMLRNSILAVLVLISTLVGVVVVNYRKQVKTARRIEHQNKNIRSSINYAKRIQEAMLPGEEMRSRYLKDSFILFKPRDVVSGDFYWMSPVKADEPEGDLAIAAMDCTGHGVPGAFMSMIGINSLNSILARGVSDTDAILGELHREIRSSLRQESTGNNDGMDASLCIYRRSRQILEFSGAKNPFVYVQNNELFQVKGDIHAIGGSRSRDQLSFRKHEISVDRPTMVYLFSDGFRDQFGGPENQKFMGKRFSRLLLEIHKLPLEEQSARLADEFGKWKGTHEQTDDVLVIGIRFGTW